MHLNPVQSVSGMFSQQIRCFLKPGYPPKHSCIYTYTQKKPQLFVLAFREIHIQLKPQLVYKVFPSNYSPDRWLLRLSSHNNPRQHLSIQYLIICCLILEPAQGVSCFPQIKCIFFELNHHLLCFFRIPHWLGSQRVVSKQSMIN